MSSFEEIIDKEGHLLYTNVGNSMMPLLRQGRDLMIITRKPVGRLKRYDVPLYKRDNGQYILHRILKTRKDDYVLCGDNQWHREVGITDRHIIGVLQAVVRDGIQIPVTDWRFRLYSHLWCDFYPVRAAVLWLHDIPRRIRHQLRKSSLVRLSQSERNLFFQLLKEGLWECPVKIIPGDVRWTAILEQLKYQTVMGIVTEPMRRLIREGLVPSVYAKELLKRVGRNMQQHHQQNICILEIFSLLQKQNYRPVLLKGQGNASFYRTPLLRQCGDIDVYIGETDYERSCHLFAQMGDFDKAIFTSKHYHISINGVIVELHRLAEKQIIWGTNDYFQQLSRRWLKETPLDEVEIEGVRIPVPPLQYNVLYVFNHLWQHFVVSGVGWRQMCDWAVLLHHASGIIDEEILFDHLKHLHLLHQWQCMGWLVVNILGLPIKEMPFYTDKVKKEANRIVMLIELEGNFGKYQKGMPDYNMKKWIRMPLSMVRITNRFCVIARVSMIDAICGYCHIFKKGFIRFFSKKVK